MDEKNTFKIPKELPNTIDDCHDLIRALYVTLSELFTRVERLEIENRTLKERLDTNSANSSLPPSKDFKKKKNTKPSTGNKSGGQVGHKGHFRKMLSDDDINTVVHCKLPSRCLCGGEIYSNVEDYQRHQVYELPEIKLHITEYRLEKGCCIACRQKQIGSLPEGITWGITGPKLTSFMSHLVSRYRLSRRELTEFLKEQFQFTLSLGTVFNKQKIVNAALETPVSNLLETIKESPSINRLLSKRYFSGKLLRRCGARILMYLRVHSGSVLRFSSHFTRCSAFRKKSNVDETGHNRDGKRQWMWGVASPTTAFFSIEPSRGKKALKSLIGDFRNVVISDRYVAYNYFDSSHRQFCWAHLKRDFTRLSEKRDKAIARIGKNLLVCEGELFKVWHEFKQGKISRDELLRQARPIRRQVGELLEQGSYSDPTLKVMRFCKNLLHDFGALWTFLSTEHVEPTNNHAERCLRHCVIWRKNYFGTRSDYGSEFVARSISIIMTCKLQSKNSFQFLSQVVQNYFSATPPPSLLMIAL